MKKILVSPLNWGLGHATRCIPVIKEFLQQHADVSIAGDGDSLKLLQKEFPRLSFFELPAYNISYSKGDSMVFKMLTNFPKIRKAIAFEHAALKVIQAQNNFDVIVSDNRYGMFHEKTYNVFITHQINIQVPKYLKWLQPLLLNYNLKQINNFKECWIPDVDGVDNLSGELSHNCKLPDNSYYIGSLSRFKNLPKNLNLHTQMPPVGNREINCQLLIILSGPEPQRTIFEKIILAQIDSINQPTLIVQGLTTSYIEKQISQNVNMVSYLTSETLWQKISEAEIIVSRSGYSTIMDLATCGKKAVLVPTPGQTEQEYLANNFLTQNIFYTTTQKDFNLSDAIQKSKSFKGLQIKTQEKLLSERINELLNLS